MDYPTVQAGCLESTIVFRLMQVASHYQRQIASTLGGLGLLHMLEDCTTA